MFRFTLKKSLLTVIIIIGLSGIVALIVNSRNFLDIAYESQRRSTNKIIHNNVSNALHELRRLSTQMGFDLQREPLFKTAFKANDIAEIQHTFDDQFAQYYTTANILSLQKIYIFDKQFNLMTMSSHGYKVTQDDPVICRKIIIQAKPRKGAERSKRIEGLCLYNDTAFHGTLLPVGLIPKAYIMIVTDPSFSIKQLEDSLSSPIQIAHRSGEIAYQSSNWPTARDMDDYLLVTHYHTLDNLMHGDQNEEQSRNYAFKVATAESTSHFTDRIQNSVNLSTMISAGFFVAALLGAILILNLTLRPLNNLQRAANSFLKGKREPIAEGGFAEIEDVTHAYNSMITHVSELITQLEDSRNKEQHANLAKSHFLANMSHELRTPLSSIIGYSEMLREENHSLKQEKHYLDTIINSGHHLQQLINDILDMSKVEAGKLEIEKVSFDLQELLFEVSSIMNINAEQKNLKFETILCSAIPKTICSDPLRLKQILINLCSNAFKFTEQGKVTIEIEYFSDVNKLLFRIKDTGTGIVQSEIDKLFKPFQQASTTIHNRFAGTGLGLALSKQLVQLLGGDISVTSEPGVGSNFTFNINTGKQESIEYIDKLEAGSKRGIENTLPPMLMRLCGRVLVAEDNPTLQDLIKVQLAHTRAIVVIANNGLEALQQASQFDFDLILMDMQMPLMDGIQTTQELRKLGIKSPIYALTANAMVEEKEKYLSIGCDGYLAKPIDKPKLYDTLMKTLPVMNSRASDRKPESEDLSGIIRLFKNSIPETKNKLQQLMATSDLLELREVLHELKAIAGSLELEKLTRLTTALELDARKNNANKVLSKIPELIAVLDEIIDET